MGAPPRRLGRRARAGGEGQGRAESPRSDGSDTDDYGWSQQRYVYPEDIEATVEESHTALRPYAGAAFMIKVGAKQGCVIVQEIKREHNANLGSVVEAIQSRLTDIHGIEPYAVILIRPGSIIRTSSGKIRRYACREAFLAGKLRILAQHQQIGVASL